MEQNNFFDSIEELNKRIGKFVIFRNDYGSLYAKLLTKIEGHKIWGKFLVGISSSGKLSVYNFSPKGETYGIYQYARDPTEQEIKQFKQMWREYLFIKKK